MKNKILKKKNKIYSVIALTVTIATVVIAVTVVFDNPGKTSVKYKVLEGQSVYTCTLDVPSSSCGSGKVTLGDANDKREVFTIEGYNDPKGRERFDKINKDISLAQNDNVWLEVVVQDNIIISTKLVK